MTQPSQQSVSQNRNRRLARMLLSIDSQDDKSERSLRRLDAIHHSQKRLIMVFLLLLAVAAFGFVQEIFF